MDLNPTDDQRALQRVARDFFAARSPLESVREIEGTEPGYSTAVYAEMAGLDWLRLGYPEEVGGAGGGLVELALLFIEAGRTLAATPHLASAVISGHVLAHASRPSDRELLEGVFSGTSIVVPAVLEPDGLYGPDGVQTPATLGADGGVRYTGTKLLVPFADSATHFLVPVRTAGTAGAAGVTLLVVAADLPGVRLEVLPNIAGGALYAVDFDVSVGPEAVLGEPGAGWDLLGPALDRGCVLRAAEVAGAGERLLEMSVEYAKTREQFGRPVGRYQAVQYLCSDLAIDTELTTLFTLHAAALADAGEPVEQAAAMAKAYGSRAARRIVNRAHEVFAGIAFMLESDVQLFTRRAKHWELDLGDDHYHRDRIAETLLR